MSAKSHKSEYTILLVLALLSGLVLLALVGKGLVREDHSGRSGVRTTRSTNVDGVLACYELCERLGIPVERSHGLLLSHRIEDADVIFLIDPVVPVNTGEIVDLAAWVERGGVLIASGDLDDLDDFDPALGDLIRENRSLTKDANPAQGLPLARDVSAAHFETDNTFALRLPDENKPRQLTGPLFEDRRGLRIVEHALGRGRLILLSDSSFLANEHIGKGDNSILAINLVSYALARTAGRQVIFDEYHFGFGTGDQGLRLLAGMLFTTSAGWAVLTLTAAGILFLLYKGCQFGPRRSLEKQRRRRSKAEYVYAVGATYRSAGAHRLTLKLIYSWFRQKTAGRVGLAPTAANSLLARELARRGQGEAQEYQRAFDDCDRLLARTIVSPHQLAVAMARLARIEKEALDGLGNGKRARP